MIGCVRRAFPGMVVSLMLAVPGYALASDGPGVQMSARTATVGVRKPAMVARKQTVKSVQRGPAGASAAAQDRRVGWTQSGVASWYGGARWQGRRTAAGTLYDQNALTAAHATLPIGSRVRVTVDGTDQAVIVTINDRPGTRTRIIDLSRAAAKELGILNRGIARVRLVRIDA